LGGLRVDQEMEGAWEKKLTEKKLCSQSKIW